MEPGDRAPMRLAGIRLYRIDYADVSTSQVAAYVVHTGEPFLRPVKRGFLLLEIRLVLKRSDPDEAFVLGVDPGTVNLDPVLGQLRSQVFIENLEP
jgi:hypothetical protein